MSAVNSLARKSSGPDFPSHWGLKHDLAQNAAHAPLSGLVRSSFGPAFLTRLTPAHKTRAPAALAAWLQGEGCTALYDQHGDLLLFEYVDGPRLADLVEKGENARAMDIAAEIAEQILKERSHAPAAKLMPLDAHFWPLAEKRYSTDMLARHGARLASFLLGSSESQKPLHGDLRPANIRRHPARGWLALKPRGLLGDPHFEAAVPLCHSLSGRNWENAHLKLRAHAEQLAEKLNLDRDRLATFAFCHACLNMLEAERAGGNAFHWRDTATALLDSLVE